MDNYTNALIVIGDQQLTIRSLEFQLEQARKEIEELKKGTIPLSNSDS